MSTRTVTPQWPNRPQRRTLSPWLLRLPILIISGLALFFFVTAAVVGAYQLQYRGVIYPGVSAMGMDLGGKTPQEVFETLSVAFTYPRSAVFTFRDGERYWQVNAADLGISLDAAHTANTAYSVGRSGNLVRDLRDQLDAWLNGAAIAPRMVYDEPRAADVLGQIAGELDVPMQNAEVQVDRDRLTAVATQSQVGRQVQITTMLQMVREHVLQLTGAEIPLVIQETPPTVWDAADAATDINRLLASPLTLYIANPREGDPQQPWVISRESLAEMLVLEQTPGEGPDTAYYQVRLDTAPLRATMEEIAPDLARPTGDARFLFNDETGEIEPLSESANGRALNIDATLASINQAVFSGMHEVPLIFNEIVPTVHGAASSAELGITALVSEATTSFAGSSAVRMNNIETAASRFHGLVVAPGQEFSFNHYLGDVSAEAGYEEGFIIYDGRTVRGVGGGVCQVSTTAFQAAFYAGFPITERYAHGYRVSYYETGEGAGMDATVFEPLVDLKFINDTPYYLLIETYFNRSRATLTFKFYSTSMNRRVVKEGPFTSNVTPHGPTLYEENPELRSGERRQVEYAVDGSDVTVRRIVYQDDQVLRTDSFVSHYLPWQAVIQVAPGQAPR